MLEIIKITQQMLDKLQEQNLDDLLVLQQQRKALLETINQNETKLEFATIMELRTLNAALTKELTIQHQAIFTQLVKYNKGLELKNIYALFSM